MSAFAPMHRFSLDGPRPGRRLILPLLLGVALSVALVLQVQGVRQGARAALGMLGGGAGAAGGSVARQDAAAQASDNGAPATDGVALKSAAGVRVAAEGRLVAYPGAQVVVGSDLAGTIVRLTVHEKETVRRGQLLAELRADDVRAELAAAQAKVVEAEADVRFAAKDADRARYLAEQNAGTQREAERTASARDAAAARLATARAETGRLEAILAKTRILAPIDGTVMERPVQPGEHVEAGAPLFTLADLRRTRIEAEVDEFDAGHIAVGAPVQVTVEGFGNRFFRAHVEEVPDAVVARRLRPQDPGRPADTRVLLVKVALDEPTPVKLGQRVEVAIAPPSPVRPLATAAGARPRLP